MVRLIGRLLALLCLLTAVPGAYGADDYVATFSTVGEFDDVKENLVFAITNRGLVVNNVSHVGEMLERTGKDLGATKQIFVHADVLEFCSATVSRQTMEADFRNIVFCPYTISIYALPAEPGKVYVSYRRPLRAGPDGSPQVLGPVDKLLHGIVQEALQ